MSRETVRCVESVPLDGALTDSDVHEPAYSGTTTDEWSTPRLEEFGTDDLEAITDDFVLSASGFRPENFTDLTVLVVDPDGDLNEDAIHTALGDTHSVEAIDAVDDETVREVRSVLEDLAEEAFGEEVGT